MAIENLDKENAKGNDRKKKKKKKKSWTKMYSEVMSKLELRALGDPFAGLDLDELRSACKRQHSLLSALLRRKHELEKRLRSTKKWRKAWNVIYTVGILAALVLLTMVATTALQTIKPWINLLEPWINSLWDKCEGLLEWEKNVIEAMQKCGPAVHELVGIYSSMHKLKVEIDVMLEAVDFAIRGIEEEEEMMVKARIERIMVKKGEVDKGIESLKED